MEELTYKYLAVDERHLNDGNFFIIFRENEGAWQIQKDIRSDVRF